MTPGARVQAAIELLDAIIVAARDGGAAADTVIARYFANRRYAGSKDRRAVRELVYRVVRLCGERPETGRAAMLALARTDAEVADRFDGGPHAPAPIGEGEPIADHGVAPRWLIDALAASGLDDIQRAALLDRAPLDLRTNTLRGSRDAVLAAIPDATPLPDLVNGVRAPDGTQIETLDIWREGLVEVQDAGSQIVTLATGVQPGMAVVDLCAGAGGKTLALTAAMENEGAVLASDIDRRLQRLTPRAERAGATIIETRLLNPNAEAARLDDWIGRADAVLIDAPCSGTGTWRRNPEARWRLTPARLARFVAEQARILDIAMPLVRSGGALTFVTCSLLDHEGAGQVAAFLARHPGWTAEPLSLPRGTVHGGGVRLTPATDDTDGFFVARLRAPC